MMRTRYENLSRVSGKLTLGEGEKLISYASLQEKEAIAFPSTSESLLGNVLL